MEKMTGALKVLDEVHDRAIELMNPSQCERGMEAMEAVAELIEAAADFKAKTFPPGSEDFSANEAQEFAVAWRRLDAALARVRSS